jgi:hypothetical protein
VTRTGFALHLADVQKTYRRGNAEPITAVDNASLDLAAGGNHQRRHPGREPGMSATMGAGTCGPAICCGV